MITCDQMLGEDPSTDLRADKEINETTKATQKLLSISLMIHFTIKATRQSAGVLLIEAAAEGKE